MRTNGGRAPLVRRKSLTPALLALAALHVDACASTGRGSSRGGQTDQAGASPPAPTCDDPETAAFLPDGPGFRGVQEAVDAALDGTVVTICPGEHPGGFVIGSGRVLTLSGAGTRPELTVLDGQGEETVLRVLAGAEVVIERLTLTNGEGTAGGSNGGALAVEGGFVTVDYTLIEENHAGGRGGAIYVDAAGGGASLDVSSTTIQRSTSEGEGGAIAVLPDGGSVDLYLDEVAIRDSNSGGSGGHVALLSSGTVRFSSSRSSFDGGTAALDGGSFWVGEDLYEALVDGQEVVVSASAAGRDGGAVALASGSRSALRTLSLSSTQIRDARAQGDGGAVHVAGAAPAAVRMESTTMTACSAGGRGGALWAAGPELSGVDLLMYDMVINANAAADADSGAVHIDQGVYMELCARDFGIGQNDSSPADLRSYDGQYCDFGADVWIICAESGTCYDY